jgi:hypothetical protein
VVANAATNIAPAPDPQQRQTKTVRPGDDLLPRQRQEVLGGGANSPPCNLLRVDKITFGHGVMSSGHSTISRPHPVLKRYEQRVHTMDQLMVSFQRWAGSADEDINFSAGQGQLMKILIYFWWAAKTIAGSYMKVMMGKLMVWALKLNPSLHQDTK